MKTNYWIIIFLFLVNQTLFSQRVGLVLSGGGGPGIAHIGVIKALEENNIPIDYITSTSIGAIVGGMYAMGMTPDEMICFFKSENLKRLITGEISDSNQYSYFKPENKPEIIGFDLQPANRSIIQLPTNLLSPNEMNYAFLTLCDPSTAVCKSNFDSLFVPFRCVASDVYAKKMVVFRKGHLNEAIRASMTFPLIFKPIEIDNTLLFDGGIYNNFPTDVMHDDFNFDYMIGSVVAYNPPKAGKPDILMQLQNMIIQPTDYTIPRNDGLALNLNLNRFGTFDFSKVDELVKIGYDSTMAHMEEIKRNVRRKVAVTELNKHRVGFKSRFNELLFVRVSVEGATESERNYILSFFNNVRKPFGLAEFRKIYYQLLATDAFAEIIPETKLNPETGYFDLNLKVEMRAPLHFSGAVNISTDRANQLYMGLTFRSSSHFPQISSFNAQAGGLYNALTAETRVELRSKFRTYLRGRSVIHRFMFPYRENSLFFNQSEAYGQLAIGFGLFPKIKIELGTAYGLTRFNYTSDSLVDPLKMLNKSSQFQSGQVFASLESNTLNQLMFPSEGHRFLCKIQYIKGNGTIVPTHWLQTKATVEDYFALTPHISLGAFGEIGYSTAQPFQNYQLTLLNAPAFQPTAFSKTLFNPIFSSNLFVALGVKPIYNFNRQLQLRTELFSFVSLQSIMKNVGNTALLSQPNFSVSWMTESAIVYTFRGFSVAALAHHSNNNWHIALNLGVLMFNYKVLE